MLIREAGLLRLAAAIVRQGGSEAAEADIVSEHLVTANLTGHDSHGVGMLPTYVDNLQAGLLHPNRPARLVTDDGAIMVFDGQQGYGQRVAREAVAAAIERCRQTGVVLLGLRSAHHIGRIGTYGEQVIAAGLVGLHFVNVTDHDPWVVPFAGREARLVTNPVCLAMPGTDNTAPLLLDMATSRIAVGKARVALNKGVPLADGMALDAAGEPCNDPVVLFGPPRGALLPFGEHKGSGLALFCELLAGALTGGGTIQPGNKRHYSIVNNMLAILVDPARLVDSHWLGQEIDALIGYVKSSAPQDPAEPVQVAGDPERRALALRRRDGIPVDDTTWEQLLAAGAKLGLNRDEARAMAGVSA